AGCLGSRWERKGARLSSSSAPGRSGTLHLFKAAEALVFGRARIVSSRAHSRLCLEVDLKPRSLRAISQKCHPCFFGAIRAAISLALVFGAMTDNPAAATCARGSHRVDGTFEA